MVDPARSPRRLQLGTGRLEQLSDAALETFLDSSWLHLGDAEPGIVARGKGYYVRLMVRRPTVFFGTLVGKLFRLYRLPDRTARDPSELYAATNFQGFRYRVGERLPFDDGSFDFVFSEHFLHHLFLDEGSTLLSECRRILRPGGVVRTVVPDADLRTYDAPEPVGFPDRRMSFDEPLKHKTRYSVYMLGELLRLTGFEPVGLHFCDRHGEYVRRDPATLDDVYRDCPDLESVRHLRYVMRPDSLIVDGIKRAG